MRAIILAAGLGTRLYPLTKNVPKCLLNIGNTTVLEREVNILCACNISDISIVVGGKGECWNQVIYNQIRKICPNVIINNENDISDHGYSLSLALRNLEEEPILVADGDVVFRRIVIEELLNSRYETALISRPAIDRFEEGGKVVLNGDIVVACGKYLQPKSFPWNIYSGIMRLGKAIFRDFKSEVSKDEHKNLDILGSLDVLCRQYLVHNIALESGEKETGIPEEYMPYYYWINLNSRTHYSYVKKIFGSEGENFSNRC